MAANGEKVYRAMFEKKRQRGKNFSLEEEMQLVDLIHKYKAILETRKSDASTWKKKEETWEKVAYIFAAKTGVERSWRALKDKYNNLKKLAKMKRAEELRNKDVIRDCIKDLERASSPAPPFGGNQVVKQENDLDNNNVSNFEARDSSSQLENHHLPSEIVNAELSDQSFIMSEDDTTNLSEYIDSRGDITDPEHRLNQDTSTFLDMPANGHTFSTDSNILGYISDREPSLNRDIKNIERIQDNERSDSPEREPVECNPDIKPIFNNDKRVLENEYCKLMQLQQRFYENEIVRASEKHVMEMKALQLKNEILELDILEKKQRLGLIQF